MRDDAVEGRSADGHGHGAEHRVDVFSTVLLAVAAVATAWATYQSAHWRSEQALASTRATAARVESTRATSIANREIQIDVATFIQWVDAYTAGHTKLAAFYFRRFRAEFRPAVTAWIATKPLQNPAAPLTPFVMPQYRSVSLAKADGLEARATAGAAEAEANVERADRYVLCVVLFAMALFFAGISTRLRSARSRATILIIGWAILATGLVWLSTFPVSLRL